MQRKVYFIERRDTGEWYYTKFSPGNEPYEGYMPTFDCGWTKDPFVAQQYPSIEQAAGTHTTGIDFELRKTDCRIVCFLVTMKELYTAAIK